MKKEENGNSAWKCYVSKRGWFKHLAQNIESWRPDPSFIISVTDFRNYLVNMAAKEKDWGFHPCVNTLTSMHGTSKLKRDIQLALWFASHEEIGVLSIKVEKELWLWSGRGPVRVQKGLYDLKTLSNQFISEKDGKEILLDIWCHSIGFPVKSSWPLKNPINRNDIIQLGMDIRSFFEAIYLLKNSIPECYNWINNVTRVVVPLAPAQQKSLRSNHYTSIPGMVNLDLFGGEINILELLIHESAHLYFFLAEMNKKLIEPRCKSLYWSPLRNELRPLRGIFVAYHALVFICAFYNDLNSKKIVPVARFVTEWKKHSDQMEKCEKTLELASSCLTEDGLKFFQDTKRIAASCPFV
jgi:hypothetical protein